MTKTIQFESLSGSDHVLYVDPSDKARYIAVGPNSKGGVCILEKFSNVAAFKVSELTEFLTQIANTYQESAHPSSGEPFKGAISRKKRDPDSDVYAGHELKPGNNKGREFAIGDSVDLPDGVYCAETGYVVIVNSILIAQFSFIRNESGFGIAQSSYQLAHSGNQLDSGLSFYESYYGESKEVDNDNHEDIEDGYSGVNDSLCDACADGDYSKMHQALEDGADITCRDNEPIRLADEYGHLDLVTHLEHLGAKLEED